MDEASSASGQNDPKRIQVGDIRVDLNPLGYSADNAASFAVTIDSKLGRQDRWQRIGMCRLNQVDSVIEALKSAKKAARAT